MATTTTSKAKSNHQSLSRSKSLGPPRDRKTTKSTSSSSEHNAEISEQKPEKPVPNYLKPTISSRGEPGKFVRKSNHNAHGLDDNRKLLRRRSFDQPPSSLSSPPSTSSPRLQKSLNISPRRLQDRPSVPREKPLTAPRSASFHANRSSPKGATNVKSPPIASRGTKKSGFSSTKKEVSAANAPKKAPDSETSQDTPLAPAQEEEKEVVKEVATTERQVADVKQALLKLEDEVESATEAIQLQPDDPSKEKIKESEETVVSPVRETESLDVTKAEEAANEDQTSSAEKNETEEQIEKETEEGKAPEDNQVMGTEVGDVSPDVETDLKVATCIGERTGDQKEVGDKEEEEESSNTKEEEENDNTTTNEVPQEGTKTQVVQGKKESPSAYNDVIEKTASKLLENRKNKVKALVGAFETVIDYETPPSK